MFKSLSQLIEGREEAIINKQIEVFLACESRKGVLDVYSEYLLDFAKISGINDIYEAEEADLDKYVNHIRETRNGQYPYLQAQKALNVFVRFYGKRGKVVEKCRQMTYDWIMPGIPKTERNEDIIKKREENKKKWTYRALADHFNVHWTTVQKIVEREAKKKLSTGIINTT